jgi:hypothetical protein
VDNSWGLPSLVLAVRGLDAEPKIQERVFIVSGKLLDHYGKSGGINGANGNAGYGSPRGYEFLHEGKLAQRFDFGLITIDAEGKGAFSPENPPSLEFDPALESAVHNSGIGTARVFPENVAAAFLTARKMALDRGITMAPDSPGQYLSFSGARWDFPGGETVRGLYFQSFNSGGIVLVLPDSRLLPPYPRIIAPPFIDALLAPSKTLSGGESLKALDIQFSGGDDFSHRIMKGLALYGIPLTDPVFINPGEERQRFSRGWIVRHSSEH